MKNLFKTEQSGRSMVEMLGVLAIVGVLSVGGIAGYSKAMAKYKTSQTLDQISMLVANIRTTFSSATSYKDLNTENARAWGIASSDMHGTGANDLINPFLGKVEVGPATANGIDNMGFAVMYSGLSRDACVSLATAGWGEGFSGVSDGGDGSKIPDAIAAPVSGGSIEFGEAADECNPNADTDTCTLALYFF